MKSKILKNLVAVKNAFLAYKNAFDRSLPCEKLFENFTRSLDNELGDYEIKYDYLCGKDTINIDGQSKGYYLQDGDLVLMDVSVGHKGVWCDVTRTFFVGKIADKHRQVFEIIVRSINEGEKVLKDGVKACEIYNAVNSEYKKSKKLLVHHAGHKIGEECLLQPQFLKDNQERLQQSDFVAIESGLYEDFGIRLENDYYLQKNGAENLFIKLMPLDIEEYILK